MYKYNIQVYFVDLHSKTTTKYIKNWTNKNVILRK